MVAPHELKNKEFTKAMRGYSIAEVDEHIDFIIAQYTELYRQNANLENKIAAMTAQNSELYGKEESINGALVDAQKAAARTINEANEQAQTIMLATKTNCDKVLAQFKAEIEEERIRLNTLRATVREFKASMFETYRTHIEFLEQISPGEVEDDAVDYTRTVLTMIKDDVANAATESVEAPEEVEETIVKEVAPAVEAEVAAPIAEQLETALEGAEAAVLEQLETLAPVEEEPQDDVFDAAFEQYEQSFDGADDDYADFVDTTNEPEYDEPMMTDAPQFEEAPLEEEPQFEEPVFESEPEADAQFEEPVYEAPAQTAPQYDEPKYVEPVEPVEPEQPTEEMPIYSRQSTPIQTIPQRNRPARPTQAPVSRQPQYAPQTRAQRQSMPQAQPMQQVQQRPTAAPSAVKPQMPAAMPGERRSEVTPPPSRASRGNRASVKDAIRQLNQTFVTEDLDDDE